jgi:MFS family permease
MSIGADVAPVAVSGAALHERVVRRIVPFLLLCYIFSYLDRINVGFAKLQMASELHFSETAYGLGAGIFFLGYFLFEVPSNMVMLRTGPRFWIGRIMITWGLVSGAMMFIQNETSYYVLRFLLGVAEAGFIPAVIYYLNCWIPSSAKGKATALFMTGIPIAGMLGGPLSGLILKDMHHLAGLSGWRWMFLLEAVPSILAGLFAFWWLDDVPACARWLSASERAALSAEIETESRGKPLHSPRDGLLSLKVWGLSALYISYSMGLYAISFWLPSIIAQSGFADPALIGLLTAVPFVAALATMLAVSASSDRRRERRWHLALPSLAGAVGLAISVAFAHVPALAIFGLTVASAGIITCVPQFYCLPPALLGGGAAAIGFAIANSVGCLAGFVSPSMIGAIKDATGSTAAGLLVVAACLLLGAGGALLVPKALVNK